MFIQMLNKLQAPFMGITYTNLLYETMFKKMQLKMHAMND